jgi:hypothetical protein
LNTLSSVYARSIGSVRSNRQVIATFTNEQIRDYEADAARCILTGIDLLEIVMKHIALIVSLCLLSVTASATFEHQDPAAANEREANQKITIGDDEKYAVEGAGATSCSQYRADREGNDALHFINLNWIKGFITGVNYIRMTEQESAQIGAGLDLDALTLWIDNYCVQHPSASLTDAGAALVNELTY